MNRDTPSNYTVTKNTILKFFNSVIHDHLLMSSTSGGM